MNNKPKTGLAVDAGCWGNPGLTEYNICTVKDSKIINNVKIGYATNNIGEFLALVHGIALSYNNGSNQTVYSDSKTAIAWVKNVRVNTTLQRDNNTRRAFNLVDRALKWLQTHDYHKVRVRHWKKYKWGEIPADFGRK